MDVLNTYTSTGQKLLYHPGAVESAMIKMGTPITLQIAPTSKCNLNCCFCSNINRNKDENLDVEVVLQLIKDLKMYGLKAIEITGGGDPMCYPHINQLIQRAKTIGVSIGLITNGVLLKKILTRKSLDALTWIRISLNALDYVKEVKIPDFKGTLGFSYVINEKTSTSMYNILKAYAHKYKAEYIRMVPNCQTSVKQQDENNKEFSKMVEGFGRPFFYQPKVFERPDNCWWCYFKPFLLHDGWVYPCSSVVLNESSGRQFHKKFRWVKAIDLLSKYNSPMKPFNSQYCDHCVFCQQNKMVDSLVHKKSQMEDFL